MMARIVWTQGPKNGQVEYVEVNPDIHEVGSTWTRDDGTGSYRVESHGADLNEPEYLRAVGLI